MKMKATITITNRGSFATIQFAWDDSARQLILDERQGSYPGMPASQVFRVVIASRQAI